MRRRRTRGGWDWDRPRGRSRPPAGSALSAGRAGTRFGATWWGRAWIEALETRARLDPNRLPRGRSYARSGAVGELAVAPGEVVAPVQGTRATPYTVRLRVRTFSDREWDRVLAAVASRAAHAAALLDGELDPGVVADVEQAGTSLLPAAGELGTWCSCPDWANPCKHAAAVCYLVADRMDADPFTILLLRGRGRDQVLAGLRRLRASAGAGSAEAPAARRPAGTARGREGDPGVEARVLFGRRDRPPLPAPPPPPSHAGVPASLPADPPPASGILPEDLTALARDAATRALEISRGTGDGSLGLSPEADLARLAAQRLGGPGFDEFARRAGAAPRALMRLALAWAVGGAAALQVLDGTAWSPSSEDLEEGVTELRRIFSAVSVRGERVTCGAAGFQLRLGRDGLWYLLVRRSGVWEIHDPPAADPAALVSRVGATPRSSDQPRRRGHGVHSVQNGTGERR
jgi:uncharacterized Zn finger protein